MPYAPHNGPHGPLSQSWPIMPPNGPTAQNGLIWAIIGPCPSLLSHLIGIGRTIAQRNGSMKQVKPLYWGQSANRRFNNARVDKTAFRHCPPVQRPRPTSAPHRPTAQGPRPKAHGPRPTAQGPRPTAHGPRPTAYAQGIRPRHTQDGPRTVSQNEIATVTGP